MAHSKNRLNLPQCEEPVYRWTLKAGLRRSSAFADKLLAEFGANVGLACDNDCTYCSSRATNRCHCAFRALGLDPFERGYGIIDPNTVPRVARDARRKKKRGLVQVCTASDAWSPAARALGLGRGCLKAILDEPGWTVRVLTKNAEVRCDFDVLAKHREHCSVGLSTTFLPSDTAAARALEPYASPPEERFGALLAAYAAGLTTFGMLCPLVPAFYQTQEKVDRLFEAALLAHPVEIFAEVLNPRGKGLIHTRDALRAAGLAAEADAVDALRCREIWSRESTRVIEMVLDAARRLYDLGRLRILLYPKGLTPADANRLRGFRQGIIWL
jgi:DNA repair photolyase